MPNIRIAVTGTQGQVARSLIERGPARDADIIAVGRPALDLADPRTVEPAIAALRPDVLVSAAGYTDTERAEAEPEVAHAINADGASALARCGAKLGVPIIQLSTDFVFDGTKPATMLKLAEKQDEVRVVADQVGNPTAAADVAEGILTVARNLGRGERGDERYGIFHMAGSGAATWAELAAAVFSFSAEGGGPSARVIPVKSSEYPMRIRRPANSRLDCTKIASVHGVTLPPWQSSLRTCVERILRQRGSG